MNLKSLTDVQVDAPRAKLLTNMWGLFKKLKVIDDDRLSISGIFLLFTKHKMYRHKR